MEQPVRQPSLSHQVLEILADRIVRGVYPPESHIPAESVLVKEFNVSRATIRRALDILETNGKVVRRQGVGSFVTAANRISNPINEPILFQSIIKESGYEPGVEFIKGLVSTPAPALARKLQIAEDGEPVIFLVNTIPTWVVAHNNISDIVSQPTLTEPIFEFLENFCNQKLPYYVSAIRADTMQNCTCLGRPKNMNEVALVFDEIGYNQQDKPILHSVHYYPGNKMKFEMIRRRIF